MTTSKYTIKAGETAVYNKLHEVFIQVSKKDSFCILSATDSRAVDQNQTQLHDRSEPLHLFYWDHGEGTQSAKYEELQRIRRRWWATKSRRRLSPASDVITDLWCIYRRGLISTLFFHAHTRAVVKQALEVKELLCPYLDGEHWSRVLLPVLKKGPQATAIEKSTSITCLILNLSD